MKADPLDAAELSDTLEAIRHELARLGERVAALEAAAGGNSRPSTAAPSVAAADPGVSEETLLVIAAAVAAFLGKKPHIRQVRLVGTAAWAQQGRVTIQASHALSAQHARSQP
jgi:methylmalonyl-CoA carboxyltransferase large subunit